MSRGRKIRLRRTLKNAKKNVFGKKTLLLSEIKVADLTELILVTELSGLSVRMYECKGEVETCLVIFGKDLGQEKTKCINIGMYNWLYL